MSDIKRAMDVFNAAWDGKRVEFYYNGSWNVERELDDILDCLKQDFKSRIDCCAECEACDGTNKESNVGK